MSMVPRDPFDVFMPLREAMNRLFEESFISPRFELLTMRTFPVDVYETEDKQQYVIEAALPGLKPEDIEVTAEDDTVCIRVAKKEETKVKKGTYVRQERYEGAMSRTVVLPTAVDTAKVQATYEHGVLTLQAPKAEAVKPKQIPIRVKEAAGAR
ncbi:MAG: Hsp20/alpha crystallin family protein [Ktedonobacteraceae bacterium]|nr:Hsp20/alpha crystallin family protein [Ktedonobacteraceae bacterium]